MPQDCAHEGGAREIGRGHFGASPADETATVGVFGNARPSLRPGSA